MQVVVQLVCTYLFINMILPVLRKMQQLVLNILLNSDAIILI